MKVLGKIIGAFGLLDLRYGLNIEQWLGCRIDSDFSFDAKIWTSQQQN
jgi:hypothetical protein